MTFGLKGKRRKKEAASKGKGKGKGKSKASELGQHTNTKQTANTSIPLGDVATTAMPTQANKTNKRKHSHRPFIHIHALVE